MSKSGNVFPPTWSQKSMMEIFKVSWNTQYWPSIAILISDTLHGPVHHPAKFQVASYNRWANADSDLYRHMVSPGYSELKWPLALYEPFAYCLKQ